MARVSPFIVAFCILMFQAVQTDLAPAIIAVSTGEGVQFHSYTTSGEFPLAGSLPPNFTIHSDTQADWLIPSPQSMVASPDGEHIAFTALSGNESALFVYTLGQNNVQQISAPNTMQLLWSPDNTAILLTPGTFGLPSVFGEPPPAVQVYEFASDRFFQITRPDRIGRSFRWTADSSALIYSGMESSCTEPCRLGGEVYLIDRYGQNNRALTHLRAQILPDAFQEPCFYHWSPGNERFYYLVGCSGFADNPHDYLFSVSPDGDNRLEADFSALFEKRIAINAIRGLDAHSLGVIVSSQTGFYDDDGSIHWYVLWLDEPSRMEIMLDIPFVEHYPELYRAVLSPSSQRIALVGYMQGQAPRLLSMHIGDLSTGQVVTTVGDSTKHICHVHWLNEYELLYELTAIDCFYNTEAISELWYLNLDTGTSTDLSDALGDQAWLVPMT